MDPQCNQCGSFGDLAECLFCESPICARCERGGHKQFCEPLFQKRKANAGATVRQFGAVPEREPFKGHMEPAEPDLTIVPPVEVLVPVEPERPVITADAPVIVTKIDADTAAVDAVLAEMKETAVTILAEEPTEDAQ